MGLALLAKESAAALPLELVVLSVFVGRFRANSWTVAKSLVALVPFGLILAAWLALYLSGPGVIQGSTIERSGLQVMHASPMEWIGQEVWAADRRRGLALGTAVATGLVMLLLGFNLVHLVSDESDWEIAGQIGKAIVQQAVQGMSGKAGTLCIANVPDNYRGKYIFRNGLGNALELADPQAHYDIKLLTDSNMATSKRARTFVVDGNPIVHSWASQ